MFRAILAVACMAFFGSCLLQYRPLKSLNEKLPLPVPAPETVIVKLVINAGIAEESK